MVLQFISNKSDVLGTWWMIVFKHVFYVLENALLIVVLKRIRNALITITSQKSFSLLILTTWVGREIKLSHLVGANANWQEWSDYPIPKCGHMSAFLYKCGHRSAFLYKFLTRRPPRLLLISQRTVSLIIRPQIEDH